MTRQFDQRMRGYDTEQVDAAIDELERESAAAKNRAATEAEARQQAEETVKTVNERANNLKVKLDEADAENRSLKAQVEQLNKQLDQARIQLDAANKKADNPYEAIGKAAQELMSDAKQNADGILRDARKQADDITSTSETRARQTLDAARKQADGITSEAEDRAKRTLANAQSRADSMLAEAKRRADVENARAQKAVALLTDIHDRLNDACSSLDGYLAPPAPPFQKESGETESEDEEVPTIG